MERTEAMRRRIGRGGVEMVGAMERLRKEGRKGGREEERVSFELFGSSFCSSTSDGGRKKSVARRERINSRYTRGSFVYLC